MPLADALPRFAVQSPDKLAAYDMGYAGLWARVCEIHTGMAALPRIARDVPELRDVPVFALLVGNHPAAVPFLAAAAATPCCVVLMDASWPVARVSDVMARARPDVLITTRALGAGLASLQCPVRYVEDVPFSGVASDPAPEGVPAQAQGLAIVTAQREGSFWADGCNQYPVPRPIGPWFVALCHGGDAGGRGVVL